MIPDTWPRDRIDPSKPKSSPMSSTQGVILEAAFASEQSGHSISEIITIWRQQGRHSFQITRDEIVSCLRWRDDYQAEDFLADDTDAPVAERH